MIQKGNPIQLFLVRWSPQRTLVPSFFYHIMYHHLSPFFQITVFTCNFMWFIKLRASAGMCGVCAGVPKCAQVYTGMFGCEGVCVCADVCWCVHVWDEFSEFLLENRVPTSADFNTYPIRIFISPLVFFYWFKALLPKIYT